jgi:hypothetical protein
VITDRLAQTFQRLPAQARAIAATAIFGLAAGLVAVLVRVSIHAHGDILRAEMLFSREHNE